MKTRIVTCRGESKQPLKVFLRHAHIIPLRDSGKDALKALYARLTTLAPGASAGEDGVDRYAWLYKEKLVPGTGFRQAQPTRLGVGNPQDFVKRC